MATAVHTVEVSTGPVSPALVDADGASAYLSIPTSTLATMRSQGEGPRFRRFGRAVRYEVAALDSWIRALPTGGGAK